MKSELNEVAYRLTREVNHFQDFYLDRNEDLVIEEYDGYDAYLIYSPESFPHPNPIIYTGDLEVMPYIDYPVTNNSWDVMSKRMLEALFSVGDFPHRALPLAIVSWYELGIKDYYAKDFQPPDEITNRDFVAVQMMQQLNIFDHEKSRYSTYPDEPNHIAFINEYVFKVPPQGLPPIFKIPEDSTVLFISAEARAALREAGITGMRYISLEGFKDGQGGYLDVPIQIPPAVDELA